MGVADGIAADHDARELHHIAPDQDPDRRALGEVSRAELGLRVVVDAVVADLVVDDLVAVQVCGRSPRPEEVAVEGDAGEPFPFAVLPSIRLS